MSVRLQVFIAAIVVIMMFMIANQVRKKKIDLKYALKWFVIGGIILVLDVFPVIMNKCSELLGIKVPSNMVFFAGIVLITVIIYSLTASVSRLSDKNKRLIQEVALLREEMENMKK